MKYFLPLFLLFVLASCSIQKRLYNKGFYTSNSRTNKKADIKNTAKPDTLLPTIKQIKEDNNTPLLAIASKAIETIHKKQINYSSPILDTKQTLLTDPCDTIIMNSGVRILCKVTKVKTDFVFFENCDGHGYSSSSIYKRDVNHIIYGSPFHETKLENKKKKNRLIAKLIALFLLLLSIVLLAVGLNQIGVLITLIMLLAAILLIISVFMLMAVALSKKHDKD